MLRFVLGRSGFGKSEYLKRLFAELAVSGNEKLLFIVPDQITFEYETAFLDILGPSLSRRILVLGFSRLCDYVFEATGHRFASFADEGVRNMVISMAIEQVADGLRIFGRRSSSRDMCEVMLGAVKEYKKCAVSPDELIDAADRLGDATLADKLRDTALVYEAYSSIMERSYIDPLDSLTKLRDILETSPVFEGYTVAMDAFYGFTAQEYGVIERLMVQSSDMYIALSDDMADGDTSLFSAPRHTRFRLKETADRYGIRTDRDIVLDKAERFGKIALEAVEENIYRRDKYPLDGDIDGVEIYKASDIYDECDFVSRTIKKLVTDGYRYRDIAVIARDTSKYSGILDTYFEKYGISYFAEEPKSIDSSPVVRFVSAAFDIVNRSFDREDVLTLLKTGLSSYGVEDIADFENYLYVWDISGKGFFDEFRMNPEGFADKFSEDDRETLNRVEALRADVIGKLRAFAYSVKDTDGRGIAKALMKLMYSMKCDANIITFCDSLEENGEDAAAEELVRMWNVLCSALDKAVAVLGDHRISAKRFSELLYINLANTEMASIPRGLDEVDIASADRGLLSENKVVFVVGAIEGEFPRTPVEAGVFTDSERVALREMKLPLSDSINELFDTELYYAYSALTAPSEKLFVSYYTADLKGEAKSPSDIVGEVIAALPDVKIHDYICVPLSDRLLSERSAFEWLIKRYRSDSGEINALKEYFSDSGDFGHIIKSIDMNMNRSARRISDSALSRALFGDTMRLSASKIDVYHKCPFMYFCEYGLKVKERRRAAIDPLEYGTLIHYIFERFFSEHSRDSFSSLDEPKIAVEVSKILDEYIERHFGGAEGKSARFLYLFYRIKSTATKLLLHMLKELGQSEFTPVDFELGVGEDIPEYKIELDEGLSLAVRGSVDRVDLCERGGVNYIRVVDYKTGVKHFNLFDIVYGINLQMFLYMSAINNCGKSRYGDIVPAGVLYMPSVSPSVSADYGSDEESVAKKVMKEYRMRGVILDDEDIIGAMERDKKGVYIPVSFKGDTVYSGSDSLASLEQLGAIFRRIDVLLTQMAKALYSGDVGAVPLKGEYDGCEYCRFKAVCLRDEGEPYRDGVKMDKDEVYNELMGEASEDEA